MLMRIKRILKHFWLGTVPTRHTLDPARVHKLTQAVAASEQRHSGEIRICVEASLPLSYLWRKASPRALTRQRALMLFGKLRVWDTEHNNGVLIYLLFADRCIEIVADRGIAERVPPETWQDISQRLGAAFRQGAHERGLLDAVDQVGALLTEHFPARPTNRNPNELPDEPDVR